MSEDFKPGTRPLLKLAGLDADRPFVSRDDENDALWTVVLSLMMRLHLDPDPEARAAKGPDDAQVVEALRAALSENFGLEAADYLAWALVHHGCRQKPTLASLPPWERLLFELQERHATTPRVVLLLRAAGFTAALAPASLEALDSWIADPVTSMGHAPAIVKALFGPRLVAESRREGEGPGHDLLFNDLLRSAVPPVAIDSLRQRSQAGGGGSHWVIEYAQGGRDWSFSAASRGDTVDVDAVLNAVDALLERLGRPDRAYRLAPTRPQGPAQVVLAHQAHFDELVSRLRLPVVRVPANAPLAAGQAADGAAGAPDPRGRTVDLLGPDTGMPSVFEAEAEAAGRSAATQPDAGMRSMMASLRRSFGAGRLLHGGRWARQAQVDPPAALAAGNDPVAIAYTHLGTLVRKGRVGWGALVLADDAVASPGRDDLPALIVYSHDSHFDARPAELAFLGARLAALRGASQATAELRDLALQLRNDSGRPLGVVLPAALTPREVVLTSVMAIRAHLPDRLLGGDWFPILTHASSAVPMIVPSSLWPQPLRAAWDTRGLVLPRRTARV